MGVRPADFHLASDRPDLPTVTAHLELLEALGTESIAYFRIDAMAITAEVHEEDEERMDAEGVTATRPNLVVAVPAQSAFGLKVATELVLGVDTAKLHAFDAESGEPLR
jgi:ABC-type sugar transport system ATPase subunit